MAKKNIDRYIDNKAEHSFRQNNRQALHDIVKRGKVENADHLPPRPKNTAWEKD